MKMKDNMISKINQTKRMKVHIMYIILKNEYIEAESRMVVTRVERWRKWGNVGNRMESCRTMV